MITKWNKSKRNLDEVYRYDDQKARNLHPAATDSKSPRLLCVLQQNGQPIWDTFCLSDFIRTRKSNDQCERLILFSLIYLAISSRQRSASRTGGLSIVHFPSICYFIFFSRNN